MLNIIGIVEMLWGFLPEGKKLGGITPNFVYYTHPQVTEGRGLKGVGDDDFFREIIEGLMQTNLFRALIHVNDNSVNTMDFRMIQA